MIDICILVRSEAAEMVLCRGKKLAEQDLTMAGVIDGQGATSKRMGMPEGSK